MQESGGGDITLTATDDGIAPEPDTLTIDANVTTTGGNGSVILSGKNVTVGTGATTPVVSTVGAGTLAVSATDATTLGANSTLMTAGAALTITTDDISIDGTAAVDSGAGITTVQNSSVNRIIDLGSNTANRSSLTDAELDRITAGTLRIGRNDALESSLVIVSATIDPALTNTLHILSGHVISQNVGANVIVSNLALSTDSTVVLSNPGNVVDTLAVSSGENVTFRNCQATALTVGSVNGVDGHSLRESAKITRPVNRFQYGCG